MLYSKKLLLLLLCMGLSAVAQAQSTDTFDLDEVYSIDAGGTIELKSDDAEVTIVGTDRADVHVEVHYKMEVEGYSFGSRDRFDMEVREQGGRLVIEEQPRNFTGITLGSVDEEYTIRIEAPRTVGLSLQGDDENYEIRDVDGAIRIDADDADVQLTACRGDSFEFNLDDGHISMDQGRGRLRIDVDDGDADIRNGSFEEIDLNTDDGSFRINTTLADGGSYLFDADDAELELFVRGGGGTFTVSHDNADISTDRAFEQTVNEENESVYRLTGGTARVRIDVDDADIELRKAN